MFIGRIGLASLLLFFKPVKSKVSNIKYPEMDLIVG
jgi:Trk-type K+ transport system membrane component